MPVNSGQNVELRFDRPAALDADLVFGADYVPPPSDVVVLATLPLPVANIALIPPARLEVLAELPGLTVSTLILRPSVPLHVGVATFADSSRLYSPAIARLTPLTMVDTGEPSFSNCSAQ